MKDSSKTIIANEIVTIFKLFIPSILIALIIAIAFSFYSNLIQISLFDKKFNWSEATEIIWDKDFGGEIPNGMVPKQYTFIFSDEKYDFMGNRTGSGSWEISEEGYVEVKAQVIDALINKSFEIFLIAIPFSFLSIMAIRYISKSYNWINRYSTK